jgi:hypothetical protein
LKPFAALVCAQGLSLAASSSAAAESPSTATAPMAVERLHIVFVGDARGRGLERLFSEWLDSSGLAVTFTESAALDSRTVFLHDEDESRIRIWLTLPERGLARITFADPRAERFLVRDVRLEDSLDELGREALAQVLVAAARAFRERRESTPREEVHRTLAQPGVEQPPAPVAPAAAPPPRSSTGPSARHPAGPMPSASSSGPAPRLRWAPGARYALRLKGPEGVSHALGALFEGGLEWNLGRLGLAVEARYEFPHRAEAEEIVLSISSVAFHFGVVGALGTSRKHGWAGELGVGFERVEIEARAGGDGDVQPRSEVRDQRSLLYAGFGPYWRSSHVRVSLGLRLDVPLARTHYDVLTDGESSAILEPWQFQPGAFATVAWD